MSEISGYSDKLKSPCPKHIILFGGGRWARVWLETLNILVSSSVRISVISPHNAKGMFAWVLARKLEDRIQVFDIFPKVNTDELSVALVANSACDHEKAIEWGLLHRFPVLVEKPITSNFYSTQKMIDLANKNKTYLASANVFLFTNYMQDFLKIVLKNGSPQSLKIIWIDPQEESRYGEKKSYDSGLPIFADWLPHIVSFLNFMLPDSTQEIQKLEVFLGGSYLKIFISLDAVPCEIRLIRNGNIRKRYIQSNTEQGAISLDFSIEPGIINFLDTTIFLDKDFRDESMPVFVMLSTFFKNVEKKYFDPRLDANIGLKASLLIDKVTPFYNKALSHWLMKRYQNLDEKIDSDLIYLYSEIICSNDPYSQISLEFRYNSLYKKVRQLYAIYLSESGEINALEFTIKLAKQLKLKSYA